jgi:hypothetical protein
MVGSGWFSARHPGLEMKGQRTTWQTRRIRMRIPGHGDQRSGAMAIAIPG